MNTVLFYFWLGLMLAMDAVRNFTNLAKGFGIIESNNIAVFIEQNVLINVFTVNLVLTIVYFSHVVKQEQLKDGK